MYASSSSLMSILHFSIEKEIIHRSKSIEILRAAKVTLYAKYYEKMKLKPVQVTLLTFTPIWSQRYKWRDLATKESIIQDEDIQVSLGYFISFFRF